MRAGVEVLACLEAVILEVVMRTSCDFVPVDRLNVDQVPPPFGRQLQLARGLTRLEQLALHVEDVD